MRSGYLGLLNLDAQPHWTIFLSDFPLSKRDRHRLEKDIDDERTRLLFVRIDRGLQEVTRVFRSAGVERDAYVSLHGVVSSYDSLELVDRLYERYPRGDLARLDLPFRECGPFHARFASHLFKVVTDADYSEQDRIADRFFGLLRKTLPYCVSVESDHHQLLIDDAAGWFQLAGRLRTKETRALPGGEVAYTGDRIEGTFVVDGAILASPETPEVARVGARLTKIGRDLRRQPICLRISSGRVQRVDGKGKPTAEIDRLFTLDDRYRSVSEVGISFNRACSRFIHSWPAASNEGRPGVHLGLGGDPDQRDEKAQAPPLVHVDLMAANCSVTVNGSVFLRASS